MKKWKILAIAFIVSVSGCTGLNWDMQKKKTGSQGPGATAEGNQAKVIYGPDGSVTATADKWTDKYGREHPGKVEVRTGRLVWAEAWGSDFDFAHIGPQKDMKMEVTVDASGKGTASGSQWPHGWTLQEILLAIGAVIFLPLIAGIVLVLIPATKPVGSVILSVYGKIFGFVLNIFKRKEKEDE